MSEEEADRTVERDDYYVIRPMLPELCYPQENSVWSVQRIQLRRQLMSFAEALALAPSRRPDAGTQTRGDRRGASLKVMTILGTRPEIIRLSLVIKLLDQYADQILVHTGQNYDRTSERAIFSRTRCAPTGCFFGM